MKSKTRNTLMTAALSCALLGSVSTVSAQDVGSTYSETGFQEGRGTYPVFIDGVSAAMRIEATQASVTTRVDGPGAENWHAVVLLTQCDDGLGPNRAIVYFKTGMKVKYSCPNPDPALYPPDYFVVSARAELMDIDDATFDPDAQRPSNDTLVSVEPPGPDDVVPPRPQRSSEEQEDP